MLALNVDPGDSTITKAFNTFDSEQKNMSPYPFRTLCQGASEHVCVCVMRFDVGWDG